MKCLRVRRLNSSILFIGIIAIAVFVAFVLTGCQKKKLAAPGATVSGTYFDTLITITAYDNTPQEVLDGAIALAYGRCGVVIVVAEDADILSTVELSTVDDGLSEGVVVEVVERHIIRCAGRSGRTSSSDLCISARSSR